MAFRIEPRAVPVVEAKQGGGAAGIAFGDTQWERSRPTFPSSGYRAAPSEALNLTGQTPAQDPAATASVAGLQDGEVAWTVPWVFAKDESGGVWIRPEAGVVDAPGGTANVQVRREGDAWVVTGPLEPEVSGQAAELQASGWTALVVEPPPPEPTVGNLGEGESGWIPPWMVAVDETGAVWVAPSCPRVDDPGGTRQVQVRRFGETLYVSGALEDAEGGSTAAELEARGWVRAQAEPSS